MCSINYVVIIMWELKTQVSQVMMQCNFGSEVITCFHKVTPKLKVNFQGFLLFLAVIGGENLRSAINFCT